VLNLLLQRRPSTAKNTIGELFVIGQAERYIYILEDTVREPRDGRPSSEGLGHAHWLVAMSNWVRTWKIDGITAIPAGTYEVVITMSNRFKKPMMLLKDVPGFSGIRIHSGATELHTEGCLITGLDDDGDKMWNSAEARDRLFKLVSDTLLAGERVQITIRNGV
jgi:hypothetical protein